MNSTNQCKLRSRNKQNNDNDDDNDSYVVVTVYSSRGWLRFAAQSSFA